ncbi:nucleoside triphosphate pyrophosphohydrolase [Paenibacillus ehimensis]|uniref:nucleoside triphosphate pyrophosphohydrolase n=1 Tax=Paenibacillus ehimensis TaxID=79264 RepID=UPI000470DA44|nr:nucleoside triphosphate pyrophosphohydrolase [Paenibacillus ehimensis]
MIIYNKLVRDKIPQIIESSEKQAEIRVLDDTKYIKMLNIKLQEELDEFLEAGEDEQITELADLVEVVYAILAHKGISNEEFERIRQEKKEKRGGFSREAVVCWGERLTGVGCMADNTGLKRGYPPSRNSTSSYTKGAVVIALFVLSY